MSKKRPGMPLDIDDREEEQEEIEGTEEAMEETTKDTEETKGEEGSENRGRAEEEPPRPRQDSSRPVCKIHGLQMVAYGSGSMKTYYRCPKYPKCRETDARVRPVGPLKNLYGNGKSAQD